MRYSGEFKQQVAETMMQEKLSYKETARQFECAMASESIRKNLSDRSS